MYRAIIWWTMCLFLVFFWVHFALWTFGQPASQRAVPDGVPFEFSENTVCFQTDYQDADCFEIHNVYHEDILPFEIDGVDPEKRILYINVDPMFTRGDDGSCEAFGSLVYNILDEIPDGWQLFVTNEWVPSAKNPISKPWAKVLAEGY